MQPSNQIFYFLEYNVLALIDELKLLTPLGKTFAELIQTESALKLPDQYVQFLSSYEYQYFDLTPYFKLCLSTVL